MIDYHKLFKNVNEVLSRHPSIPEDVAIVVELMALDMDIYEKFAKSYCNPIDRSFHYNNNKDFVNFLYEHIDIELYIKTEKELHNNERL